MASFNPSKDSGPPTSVATFRPDTRDKFIRWFDARNGKENLYWSVNPVKAAMSKKPARTDIVAVVMLHVDVDPVPGQDLEEEQDRILGLFITKGVEGGNRPDDIPEPTAVVFSGGGYQAFWKLKEPIRLNGTGGLG